MLLHTPFMDSPAFTFSVALAVGLVAQVVAHHLKMPGIVLFLLAGVVLGPDALGIIRPESLGEGLETLVGMAVAVILFEGGLNLSLRRVQRAAKVIRKLIGIGALITWLGGTLAARFTLAWPWSTSLLFGALVIVTGPTVIAPLIRRIRLQPRIATILEAEGVLIDPVGAIIAVVALEEVVAFASGEAGVAGLIGIPSRLLLGGVVGLFGGLTIGLVIKKRGLVPEGLENVFTLALALFFYEMSNAIMPESGIMQAAVAGMVVGNMKTGVHQELKEFKEQLTIMLVGMLFVLLAANVRLDDVLGLGWPAAAAILLLVAVVRPIVVAYSTWGSDLSLRERTFIAWLSPRGIVAAAVASLFAQRLDEVGLPGGTELQGMVFLVIASTVIVQGLTGAWVAGRLGLRLPTDNGYIIAGAHALGRALGRALRDGGNDVRFADTNPQQARAAEDDGFQVAYGNAAEESVLLRLDIEGRRGFIAMTPNPGVNLLLCNSVGHAYNGPKTYAAVVRGRVGVKGRRVRSAGHSVVFGRGVDVPAWSHNLDAGNAAMTSWRYVGGGSDAMDRENDGSRDKAGGVLFSGGRRVELQIVALTIARGNTSRPVDETTAVAPGDIVTLCYIRNQREHLEEFLGGHGWEPVAERVTT